MGYLDKSTITVDAILTNRGRELLAQGTGTGAFQITKFSVSDDEIDYGLWNTAHPLGSQYYGSTIENMPVLEATPDETQIMRYKLVTITGPQTGTQVIPQITNINYTTQTLYYNPPSGQSKQVDILPKTTYTAVETNQESGYTLLVADGRLITLQTLTGANDTATTITANTRGSLIATGTKFRIIADKNIAGSTTVTVYGNTSGASYSFTLTTIASA